MGNRAKRSAVARRLKTLGLGRLYTGNKKVAWRYLNGYILDAMLRKLAFAPGDLVNDCDGFNHLVVRHIAERLWNGVICVDQFEREDGAYSCGCKSGPEPARTPAEIARWFQRYFESVDPSWCEGNEAMIGALAAGRPICDERGLPLPGLKQ